MHKHVAVMAGLAALLLVVCAHGQSGAAPLRVELAPGEPARLVPGGSLRVLVTNTGDAPLDLKCSLWVVRAPQVAPALDIPAHARLARRHLVLAPGETQAVTILDAGTLRSARLYRLMVADRMVTGHLARRALLSVPAGEPPAALSARSGR